MKVKILKSKNKTTWYTNMINQVIDVKYDMKYQRRCFTGNNGVHNLYNDDIVITELPESFCVKRCDDNNRDDWNKYLQWLNKQKNYPIPMFGGVDRYKYYGVNGENLHSDYLYPFGTEIHIDDMIKHIDYMESQQHIKGGEQFSKESQLTVKMNKEFNLTSSNEGRLAYARQNYPIGTKYIPLYSTGESWDNIKTINYNSELLENGTIDGGFGFVYASGKWAEIIKEEINMDTQKLSRKGLKEIHSIACSTWKNTLEQYGSRNPLEDYIELSQKEIDMMFNASDDNQKSILSKYLKQNDGSINFDNLLGDGYKLNERQLIGKRTYGQYKSKSFYLDNKFDWKIQKDEYGELCLIPTKQK